MKTYLFYLVESAVCMAVLFLFYYCFLRSLTFYRVRRYFLLMIIVVSILIPVLEIETASSLPIRRTGLVVKDAIGLKAEAPRIEQTNASAKQVMNPTTSVNAGYFGFVSVLYLAGCSFMCFRLLRSLYKVSRIKTEAEIGLMNGRRIFFHHKAEPAFSFGNSIFLHPSLVEQEDMKTIFEHEESHVKEGHTYDVLFVEGVKIIFWVNPILYLLSQELAIVHEFQADEKASRSMSRKDYARLLLSHVQQRFKLDITNTFFQLPIKRRIHQLFRRSSSFWGVTRLIFVFPVLVALFFFFSCASEFEVQTRMPNGKKLKNIKVIYHDEFGDVPEYDGAIYSSVEFDRRGKILDLKKGTFHENVNDDDLTLLPHLDYTLDNILWYLDYGFYTHNETYLAMGVDNWLESHINRIEQFYKNVEVRRNEYGAPLKMFFTQKRDLFEHSEEWIFTYDENRKLQSIGETRRSYVPDRGWETYTTSRRFEHNVAGKLISIRENESGIDIIYDAEGNIAEVVIAKNDLMIRRFAYTYGAGLRSHCTAFNKENQKEFTLDYLYSFF